MCRYFAFRQAWLGFFLVCLLVPLSMEEGLVMTTFAVTHMGSQFGPRERLSCGPIQAHMTWSIKGPLPRTPLKASPMPCLRRRLAHKTTPIIHGMPFQGCMPGRMAPFKPPSTSLAGPHDGIVRARFQSLSAAQEGGPFAQGLGSSGPPCLRKQVS